MNFDLFCVIPVDVCASGIEAFGIFFSPEYSSSRDKFKHESLSTVLKSIYDIDGIEFYDKTTSLLFA